MTNITIPTEAVEAASFYLPGYHSRDLHAHVRAAIAAALNAWPGMIHDPGAKLTKSWYDPGKITLPFPAGENQC